MESCDKKDEKIEYYKKAIAIYHKLGIWKLKC